MNKPAQINFVIALDAEAQPLIHYFRLKRDHEIKPFAVYKNDNKQLIVSGIGKRNAMVATGYLAGLSTPGQQAWLNVGIAGGDVECLGDTVMANAIMDQETKRRYYPSLCFDIGLPQTEIVTTNKPAVSYKAGVLYDMEAAGFYDAASHFSTSEIIHCCKIISDNSDHGIDDITKESTLALIEANFEKIENMTTILLNSMDQISTNDRVEKALAQLVKKYHFTTSQQNALKILVQNWFALDKETDFSVIRHLEAKNPKHYLEALSNLLSSKPVSY